MKPSDDVYFEVLPLEDTSISPIGYNSFINIPNSGELLMAFRQAGNEFGFHYHKGNSASKNPQVAIICSGKIRLNVEDLKTGRKDSVEIEGPRMFKIYPYVWDSVLAITDFTYIEFNSKSEHSNDTFYEKQNFWENFTDGEERLFPDSE